jgi:nitrous oxide reductase accessory protein NosL
MTMKKIIFSLALFFGLCCTSFAAQPVKPTNSEKCPVCGMFVAKYPDFLTEIIFKDGSHAVFDGAKDMFKFLFDISKYAPSRKAEEIDSIFVTDYYSFQMVDGREAFYVIGSNVLGPMGKELVPFAKKEDSEEFTADHMGKSMLRFNKVTPELVKTLD